jgi:hypothetical protein
MLSQTWTKVSKDILPKIGGPQVPSGKNRRACNLTAGQTNLYDFVTIGKTLLHFKCLKSKLIHL